MSDEGSWPVTTQFEWIPQNLWRPSSAIGSHSRHDGPAGDVVRPDGSPVQMMVWRVARRQSQAPERKPM